MNCLKCGREAELEQVFCEECLRVMEKYPVKPDTAVKLPERRSANTFRRSPKRRTVPLEEQVKILKNRVFRLTIVLMLSFGAIFLMIPSVIAHYSETHYKPGQNYSVISTTAPTEATAAAVPTEP